MQINLLMLRSIETRIKNKKDEEDNIYVVWHCACVHGSETVLFINCDYKTSMLTSIIFICNINGTFNLLKYFGIVLQGHYPYTPTHSTSPTKEEEWN